MVSKLDQSVGNVVEALKNCNMLDNSIIIFMADNGAPTSGFLANHGSNYPLRGVSIHYRRENFKCIVSINVACFKL